MQALAVIFDLVAIMLLVMAAARGAKGAALEAIVPMIAAGLGLAGLGALLAAQPTFGHLLLVMLAVGLGATLGASAAIVAPVVRIPLLLNGFLVLYGIVALLLALAVADPAIAPAHAQSLSGMLERMLGAVIAAIAGGLVFGGGGVLFVYRLRPVLAARRFDRALRPAQIAPGAVVGLAAILYLVTDAPLALWSSALAATFLAAAVVTATDAGARWPLSVLLTALCGLATAAIGFALASLLLIMAGGMVSAAMAAVFSGLCREARKPALELLFGPSD